MKLYLNKELTNTTEMLHMAYHQNSIYLHERIAIDGNFDDKENFNHK
jgi:hypothetical protein